MWGIYYTYDLWLKKNWKLTLLSPVLYKPVFKMVRPIFCILIYVFQYYVCLKKGLTESLIFSYFLQWLITISAIWKDHSCLSFVWEWNCLESVRPHLVIVTHPPSLFKQCSILVFQAQQTCYSRSRVIYTIYIIRTNLGNIFNVQDWKYTNVNLLFQSTSQSLVPS